MGMVGTDHAAPAAVGRIDIKRCAYAGTDRSIVTVVDPSLEDAEIVHVHISIVVLIETLAIRQRRERHAGPHGALLESLEIEIGHAAVAVDVLRRRVAARPAWAAVGRA